MKLRVDNMSCGGCVRAVTAAIRAVDPAASVEATLETRDVSVTTAAPRERIVAALAAAGFEAA